MGVELSEENKRALWVPAGFAHGFLTMSSTADVHYKCTDVYDPSGEETLRWDDASVGIAWPTAEPPQLSEKDETNAVALENASLFE